MSVSVHIVALREITEQDLQLIGLYNGLIENEIKPPPGLLDKLLSILGDGAFHSGDLIPVPEPPAPDSIKVVELAVEGKGDVMYGDGKVVLISDLPANTIALRIYTEA